MRRSLAVLLLALPLSATPQEAPVAPGQPPAPDPTYLPELLAGARQQRLSEDEAWLRLGHWRRRALGGWKSEADGRAFFRAPSGKTDPAAELEATLAGLLDASPQEDELDDAQCRFPARFAYLAARLGIDFRRLPLRRCPRLEAFLSRLSARGATLVFSSWYLNNPASAFGHTFLRLDKADGAVEGRPFELLDYGVDYAAQVDTGNAILYALKGLFGLFRGQFNHYAYYYKVREYADYESRDLWEYDLALAPGEVAMLQAHLWELGGTWFEYWYLDENCSYHVLGALEAAAPRLRLLAHVGRFVVLPSDTVRALFRNDGLVRRVHWRPSIRTQFEARAARLSTAGRTAVSALAGDASAPFPAALPDTERAGALDAAVDLVDVRRGKAILLGTDPEAARLRQALLERRSALLVPSPALDLAAPEERRPDRGHGSTRLELGGGASRHDGPLVVLDLRLAFHDLLDPPAGYPRTAQIEFLPLRLRWAPRPRRLELDDGSLVRVVSLSGLSRFDWRPSWRMRFGATTVRDAGCARCLAADAEVGGGFATLDLLGAADLLVTGDVTLQSSPGLSGIDGRPVRAGLGPSALLRLRGGERVSLAAEGRWRWLPYASPRETWLLRAEARLHLVPWLSLALEGRRTPADAEALGLAHLFF
jgi:hypothetical protein